MAKRLVELAELRRETIVVAGEPVVCEEPSALVYTEYRRLLNGEKGDLDAVPPVPDVKPNKRGAVAHLIEHCTFDADGHPYFTSEEALKVAGGRSQVFAPLVVSIVGFIGREKKASNDKTADSSTDSPGTSAEPSAS